MPPRKPGTVLAVDAIIWQRLDSIHCQIALRHGLPWTGVDRPSDWMGDPAQPGGPYETGVELAQWPQKASDVFSSSRANRTILFRIERQHQSGRLVASDLLESDDAGTLLLIDSTANDPLLQLFPDVLGSMKCGCPSAGPRPV